MIYRRMIFTYDYNTVKDEDLYESLKDEDVQESLEDDEVFQDIYTGCLQQNGLRKGVVVSLCTLDTSEGTKASM